MIKNNVLKILILFCWIVFFVVSCSYRNNGSKKISDNDYKLLEKECVEGNNGYPCFVAALKYFKNGEVLNDEYFLKWLEKSCDLNYTMACKYLSVFFDRKDEEERFVKYLEKSCEIHKKDLNESFGNGTLGRMLVLRNYAFSVSCCWDIAKYKYLDTRISNYSIKKAFEIAEYVCEKGFEEGCLWGGEYFLKKNDYDKALKWYSKGCKRISAVSCINAAEIYHKMDENDRAEEKIISALKYLKRPMDFYYIAKWYWVVKKDKKNSINFLEKAILKKQDYNLIHKINDDPDFSQLLKKDEYVAMLNEVKKNDFFSQEGVVSAESYYNIYGVMVNYLINITGKKQNKNIEMRDFFAAVDIIIANGILSDGFYF